jgi:hypothetical protein
MTRAIITMTIDDAEHYTPEQREKIVASYLPHERAARARGEPVMGSGLVFPIEEEAIKVTPFAIPAHWPRINGIDFGWDHPSAGVQAAWDRDADIWYVTRAHRAREQTPILFAPSILAWGKWVPCAWPHDGLQHDKGSGVDLAKQYAAAGLLMLKHRATHPPDPGKPEGSGGNGVEAGLMDMLDRMQTGRFKVFSNLDDWFQEFRIYHRKDGLVVKLRDDLMSATRIGLMMKRKAIVYSPPVAPAVQGWAPLDAEIGY